MADFIKFLEYFMIFIIGYALAALLEVGYVAGFAVGIALVAVVRAYRILSVKDLKNSLERRCIYVYHR